MINFTVLREKRRTISKGSCPVDLMGDIARYGRDIEAVVPYCYRLTIAALNAMCLFPVRKKVSWIPDVGNSETCYVTVTWFPSSDEMELCTTDGGETFMVMHSRTVEIECDIEEGAEYIRYTIDVEWNKGKNTGGCPKKMDSSWILLKHSNKTQ